MTARHSLARLVYEDAAMLGLGFTESRVWQSSAIDTPDRSGPFVVINVDATAKAFGITGQDTVSYWVHVPRERVRDYGLIDIAIARLKELMEEVVHLAGEDGWSLTAASWVDASRDFTDEAFNTIVKTVTFQVASRSLVTP
jgi:hypothetical protein